MRVSRLAALALCALALLPACARPAATEAARVPEETAQAEAPVGEGTPTETVEVLMLGRSVMRGWMDSWWWDGSTPVRNGGYAFDYRELAAPPDIASSAADFIREAEPGTIVVFKHCFVDFEAPGAATSARILARNKAAVIAVADAARARKAHLIVGTSLPQVRSASSPALVAQHRAYDEWLRAEAERRGFRVLEMSAALAGEDGALRPELAVSPDDAHLIPEAYLFLDLKLVPLLDEVTR